MVIRGYRPADEAALLALWSAALPLDAVDAGTLRRKVFCDPSFHADWLLLAQRDGELLGFLLALIRREPFPGVGLEPERGWITAFGVRPEARRQGVGGRLLGEALELFREAGRTSVSIAPYVPCYFVPGVDVKAYAEGLAFLEKRGFEVVSRPLSMDANLVTFDFGPYRERRARLAGQGVVVRALAPAETPAFLAFLAEQMPPDWVRHARELLSDAARGLAGYDQVTVAAEGDALLGYCQFGGEHFGPFGVRAERQGQGIGTVLLATALETMRARGLHHAWVLWTSDETAARVYTRFGFTETRRFAVLRRGL
ncbi:MAG: GNAT family N-acetyltransferase [Armatimonadetes bacterium]|nr:GNAT family N-acetyltransferase [Armatimonadota bacterium]